MQQHHEKDELERIICYFSSHMGSVSIGITSHQSNPPGVVFFGVTVATVTP